MATLSSMLGSKILTHDQKPADKADTLTALLNALEVTAGSNSEAVANAHRGLRPPQTAQQLLALPLPRGEVITPFHSIRVCRYSLAAFGRILRQNFRTTTEIMIAAIVILIRYCETANFRLTLHSMHRMLAASIVVAVKTHCDFFFSNEGSGQACGLCLEEVNRLEAAVCKGTEWRLLVLGAEIDDDASLLRRITQLRPAETPAFCADHRIIRSRDPLERTISSFNSATDDYIDALDRSVSPRSMSPIPSGRV